MTRLAIIWTAAITTFTIIVWRREWSPLEPEQPPLVECSFCGDWRQAHPDSDTQYGEPVCHRCFDASYTPDLIPGVDYEPAVCDVCGHDVHTPAELADCIDSALAPVRDEP